MSNDIPRCRSSRIRLFLFYVAMAFRSLTHPQDGREMIEAANAFIAKRIRDATIKNVLGRTPRPRQLVAHHTAAKDAEIEALRAVIDNREAIIATHAADTREYQKQLMHAQARAERLAEALREIEGFTLSQFAGPHDMAAACIEHAARALLREQEARNG